MARTTTSREERFEDQLVMVSTRVPRGLRRKLRVKSDLLEITIQAAVREALVSWLAEHTDVA